MNKLDKETLFINLESSINKAEHIAEKIIQEYGLDIENSDELADMVLVSNRGNIGIEMDMLTDYIRSIRSGYDSVRKAVEV